MSFLVKENKFDPICIQEIPSVVISGKDFFFKYHRLVLYGWNLIAGYYIHFLLAAIIKFGSLCIQEIYRFAFLVKILFSYFMWVFYGCNMIVGYYIPFLLAAIIGLVLYAFRESLDIISGPQKNRFGLVSIQEISRSVISCIDFYL